MDSAKPRLELAQVDDRRWVLVHVGRQLREAVRELLSVTLLPLVALPPRSEHACSVPAGHAGSYVICATIRGWRTTRILLIEYASWLATSRS